MNTRHAITAAALLALVASPLTAAAQGPIVLPSTGLTLDAPFPVTVTTNPSGDVITRSDRSKPALSASFVPNPSAGDPEACEKSLQRLVDGSNTARWAPSNLIVNGAWHPRAVYFKVGQDSAAVVCLSDSKTYVHSFVRYAGDFHDVDFDQGRALMLAVTDMTFGPSDSRDVIHHLATSRVMLEEPGKLKLEVVSTRRFDVITSRGGGGPEFVIEFERTKLPSCGEALEARAREWDVAPTNRGVLAPPSWHAQVLVLADDVPTGVTACVEGEEGRFLATLYYRGAFTSKDYRSRVVGVFGALSNSVRARTDRAAARAVAILRPRVNLGSGELDFRESLGVKVRDVPGLEWSYQDRAKGLQVARRGDSSINALITRANFPGFTCSTMLEKLSRDGKFGELRDAPYLPPSWHGRALEKLDSTGIKGSACLDLPDDQGVVFATLFSDDPDLSRPEFVSTFGVLLAHIAHAYGVSKGPRSWLAWDRMGL